MTFFTDNPALFAVHQQFHAPGTLPDGTEPLIFADFKNGIYTVDGDPVEFDDIFGSPLEGFGQVYDPDGLVAGVGFRPTAGNDHTNKIALKGAALALVTSGSTMLLTAVGFLATPNVQYAVHLEMSEGPDDWFYYLAVVSSTVLIGQPDHRPTRLEDNSSPTRLPTVLSVGDHKAAVSMTDNRMAMSIDGGAVLVRDPADIWTPAPTQLMVEVRGQAASSFTLEKLAIYPPQDDAELPALSAL